MQEELKLGASHDARAAESNFFASKQPWCAAYIVRASCIIRERLPDSHVLHATIFELHRRLSVLPHSLASSLSCALGVVRPQV
jgi:hypothetical protein